LPTALLTLFEEKRRPSTDNIWTNGEEVYLWGDGNVGACLRHGWWNAQRGGADGISCTELDAVVSGN
jgi:hypothetical protein